MNTLDINASKVLEIALDNLELPELVELKNMLTGAIRERKKS